MPAAKRSVKRKVDLNQMDLGFSVEEVTRVPWTDWKAPDLSKLPDKLYGLIGVDTETDDLGLSRKKGAGWGFPGGGQVVGYSVTADNWSGYLPIGHIEGNVDPDQARRWLRHVLSDSRQPKLFANAMYDLGWAQVDGVAIHGPPIDVLWTEALLDENRLDYSLDSISKDRLGISKEEDLLREAAKAYGVDPKKDIAKLPAKYAAPYAIQDSALPRMLWEKQEPLIRKEELTRIFKLEHDLIPMYIDMRIRGVRIDVAYAEALRDELRLSTRGLIAELKRRTGFDINVWAAESISKLFDAEGLPYPLTAKTKKPSIDQALLERTDHWAAKAILVIRQKEKLISTFLEGQILEQSYDGRVHGQIHPLKTEEGGTGTGRLAMSDPNLQFIPTRTEEGKKIRRCFLPEEGEHWASIDVSQQEPRLTVHYAALMGLPGAWEARDRYLKDPDMSYHEFAADLTGLNYKAAKILNLAIIYGRGIRETAAQLGLSYEETEEMFRKHDAEMPFAKKLASRCRDKVQSRGYIRSILGRKVRFDLWEPMEWDRRDGRMFPLELAKVSWPGVHLTRARIHKALNSLIQPSAADQLKKAMLDVWNEGLGHHVLIQVHDELDSSVAEVETAVRIAEIMRDAVPLQVPVRVAVKVGANWSASEDGEKIAV